MISFKKLFVRLFVLLLVAFPLSLNAQNENTDEQKDSKDKDVQIQTTDQNQDEQIQNQIVDQNQPNQINNDNTGVAADQFNQKLSQLNGKPSDELERQFQVIAEQQVTLAKQKLNLSDEKSEALKEAIVDYLTIRWENEVEVAKLSNDPKKMNESATDLAYLRVDLAENIKDELSDTERNQWDSYAVNFWTSLDTNVFDLQMQETGIASDNKNNTDSNY